MLRRLFPCAGILLLALPAFSGAMLVDGRRFTVPEGFTVERVSATNQVLRPVNACLDDQGRLYVTDSSGSSQAPAEQAKDPKWRVMRLEDRDGDGQFEKAEIFADKLPMLQGILWHEGIVYVGGTPAIWKLIDKDGDGRADKRVEWWNVGRAPTHCGNEVHGPYAGPDGFLYWTKGAFEPIAWTNGVTGQAHLDRGAHIFRARPDGSEMDSIMTGGMDNPVEVAFTPDGECLFTSTFIDFSQPGFRDGLAHAIFGGVYGKANGNIEDRAVKRTGPDLLHPFVQFGAGAPSGLCRYTAAQFGNGYRDNFFATLFNMHKVTRHQIRPNGVTFQAETSDFLATEETDFHPTDVLEDIDGSLLVVDTGGWYKLCCPTSQLWKPDVLGVLYRVKRVSTVGSRSTRPSPRAKPEPGNAAIRKGSIENWKDRIGKAEAEPFAAHSIIEALIRSGDPVDLRRSLAASDPTVQRAALIALAERDGSDLKPEEVTPFLLSNNSELRRVADWVIRRRGEWGASLVGWAREQLPLWVREGKGERVGTLMPLLLRDSAGHALLADCASRQDYPLSIRTLSLETMAGANLKEPPQAWAKSVALVLSDPSALETSSTNSGARAMVAASLRLLRQLKDSGDHDGPHAAARGLAENPRVPLDLRLQSLASRPARSALSRAEFEMARNHLVPEVTPSLRVISVKALTRSGLAADQLSRLAETMREVGPLEINPLLACFEGASSATLGKNLLDALREAKARNALRPEQLKPALAKFSLEHQNEGAALMAQLLPDISEQVRRIDSLLQELKALSGDVRRGQAVFNSAKTACVQCHRIGYAGGELGPNLTRIGEARTERDLLEAVVYPNASFVRSYEPVMVTTKAGDLLSGIIKEESDVSLTLVTGPGAEQRLERAEIGEQRPGSVSLMPGGLDEQLTRQELADLVAFLKHTQWGAQ